MASSDNLNKAAQKGWRKKHIKRHHTQSPKLLNLYCIIIKSKSKNKQKRAGVPGQKEQKEGKMRDQPCSELSLPHLPLTCL